MALALCASTAQAETKLIQISIQEESKPSISTTTIEMGQPNALMGSYDNADKFATTCNFKSSNPEFPSQTSFSVDTGTVLNGMALPMELTESGVKAYLSFDKQSSKDLTWATVSPDCKLPVGELHNAGVSLVGTYKWGVPSKIKLSDGTVVIVTVNKAKELKL